ncbi:MAG: glycine cleavage system protein GcvH [Actinobacteria bacterium]|nr:glycine cleavage system protein GcvH [Actinomycetota bacterium]
MQKYPNDRLYYEQHEWVKQVDEKTVIVGISYHAQDSLGDIVYISEPEVEKEIQKGDEIAEIESVKAVSQIYAPVSGRIVEVNKNAIDNPEIINRDPYEEGWLVKIELTNPSELEELMDANAYRSFVEEG